MSSHDLERRVEDLEGDIATLKEALESVLEWTGTLQRGIRNVNREFDDVRVRFQGTNKTKEILDRLP